MSSGLFSSPLKQEGQQHLTHRLLQKLPCFFSGAKDAANTCWLVILFCNRLGISCLLMIVTAASAPHRIVRTSMKVAASGQPALESSQWEHTASSLYLHCLSLGWAHRGHVCGASRKQPWLHFVNVDIHPVCRMLIHKHVGEPLVCDCLLGRNEINQTQSCPQRNVKSR